jgi:hypothetical protein
MALIFRQRVLRHDDSVRRYKAAAIYSVLLDMGNETSEDDEVTGRRRH